MFLFFIFLLSFARRCCQRLAIQSNVGVLRSGFDCGLKDYYCRRSEDVCRANSLFSVWLSLSRITGDPPDVGVCVHKRSLDFLATQRGIRSREVGGRDRRPAALLLQKSVLELQEGRENMAVDKTELEPACVCSLRGGWSLSDFKHDYLFLPCGKLTFKKWTVLTDAGCLRLHKQADQAANLLCSCMRGSCLVPYGLYVSFSGCLGSVWGT